MQMLKSKLYLLKQQENLEKVSDIRGEVKDMDGEMRFDLMSCSLINL